MARTSHGASSPAMARRVRGRGHRPWRLLRRPDRGVSLGRSCRTRRQPEWVCRGGRSVEWGAHSSRGRRARYAVRLDEDRWSAGARECAERGRRVADELGDVWPNAHTGQRCGSRRRRLIERGREVLTQRAVIRMDTRALGTTVGLNVRRSIGLIARGFELRIGQRRGAGSGKLDQRNDECQEPHVESAKPHVEECKAVRRI